MLRKRPANVAEESGRLQDGLHDDRLEYIQLKVTVTARYTHRCVVANHLRGYHRHHLTLRGIHLTCAPSTAKLIPAENTQFITV